MRSFPHASLSISALMLAALFLLALPSAAHASEDGYRLLELDGHIVKWGNQRLGIGASVSYAFARETLRFDEARNCGDLAPVESLLGQELSMETLAREAAAAFRVWERAAGLTFHEIADARNADIILGAQGRPRGQAFANVSYAPDAEEGVRSIEQALVCLNPEHEWKVGFDGDEDVYDIRYTLIHEIGHTIGLDHPGRSGQVMAFRYTEDFNELQPGDLRGVQRLYGPTANERGLADSIGIARSGKTDKAIAIQLGRIIAAMMDDVGDFLAIGKVDIGVPWNHVEFARHPDQDRTKASAARESEGTLQ